MKILSAEFIKSCAKPEQFPHDGLPEVAFVGRSNVGKSSLLNSLLHRRKLAKVSRTPGKTCTANFFRLIAGDPVLKRFSWVDLPGYGYAKVAKSVQAQWGPMIEGYLTERPELMGVLLLVDARGVERHDVTTFAWLRAPATRTAMRSAAISCARATACVTRMKKFPYARNGRWAHDPVRARFWIVRPIAPRVL